MLAKLVQWLGSTCLPAARAHLALLNKCHFTIAAATTQEHIIHGDLKASNVLLKTSIPSLIASGSNSSGNNNSQPAATSVSGMMQQQPSAASGGIANISQLPGATPAAVSIAAAAAGSTGSTGSSGFAVQVVGDPARTAGTSQPSLPASTAILVAAEEVSSGMHCLLKGGWVVGKVSDFGLSLCVDPGETHVSSVHAVSTRALLLARQKGFAVGTPEVCTTCLTNTTLRLVAAGLAVAVVDSMSRAILVASFWSRQQWHVEVC